MAAGDLVGIVTIAQQRFWQIAEPRHRGEPQPQIEILGMAKGGVIAADGAHHIGAEHHRRVAQQRPASVDAGEELLVRGDIGRRVAGPGGIIVVDILGGAADHTIVAVLLQKGDLRGETMGQANVIGVHTRDQGRAGLCQQLVEAGDEAPVLADDGANAGVLGGVGIDDCGAAIRGAIVANQKFKVGKVLRQHALYRGREKAFAIIDAERDANGRADRASH